MSPIKNIFARPILDSRGQWTIEVALTLLNRTQVVASVPQGVSRGSREAQYVSPARAVRNIVKIITPLLKGRDPSRQEMIDRLMIARDGTAEKSRLGANAILGVSMVCARAAAASQGIPFWKHLRQLSSLRIKRRTTPRLFINLIEGGLHANNGLDFQEYLLIPMVSSSSRAISMGQEVYGSLRRYLERRQPYSASVGLGDEGGFSPMMKNNLEPFEIMKKIVARLGIEENVSFGIDAAAQNFRMGNQQLLETYKTLKKRFNLSYIEDPFRENDFGHFAELRRIMGLDTLIAGDDLTVTNLALMEKARRAESINGVVVKPNQIGTLTEAFDAVRFARRNRWMVIVSHRGGETNDDFVADFAYGVGADGFKLGAPARGERIAKYNRLLAIEHSK